MAKALVERDSKDTAAMAEPARSGAGGFITGRNGLVAGCVCGLLAAAPGHAVPFTAAFEVIVDGGSEARSITIGAGELGGALNIIKDVNITIDFMKCAGDPADIAGLPASCPTTDPSAAHELRFVLEGPGPGIPVVLVDLFTYDPLAPGARITLRLDDEAATGVGAGSGGLLQGDPGDPTERYQPIGLLAEFDGLGAIGNWTLTMQDDGGLDPLGVAGFTLDITFCSPTDTDPLCRTAVPAPATPLLLGFGLLGLAGWRRRWS